MNKSKIFALFAITMLVMLVLVEDTEAAAANDGIEFFFLQIHFLYLII
jgi:hypothetical protein